MKNASMLFHLAPMIIGGIVKGSYRVGYRLGWAAMGGNSKVKPAANPVAQDEQQAPERRHSRAAERFKDIRL